jgi:hypothetical protein
VTWKRGVKRLMGETGRERVNREKGLTDEYEKDQKQGINKIMGWRQGVNR